MEATIRPKTEVIVKRTETPLESIFYPEVRVRYGLNYFPYEKSPLNASIYKLFGKGGETVIEQDEIIIKGLLKRISDEELETLSRWIENEQLKRTIEQVMNQ